MQTTLTTDERRHIIRLARQIGKQQTVFACFLFEENKEAQKQHLEDIKQFARSFHEYHRTQRCKRKEEKERL